MADVIEGWHDRGRVLHDLSRGCSVDDMVNVAVIVSLQAAPDC